MPSQPGPENSFIIEPGSFRDRHGRVFYHDDAVYRGISEQVFNDWKLLSEKKFFKEGIENGKLINTELVPSKKIPESASLDHWAAILKHQKIPFISYPYEWSFGMLKDAALLQLELLHRALDEEMILKDSSSFNIQWIGASPTFIDIASFEKLVPGTPWAGYRQFCELFLYPLMLQAYKDIPFHPWLRGSIDGIHPEDFNNLMTKRDFLRAGVLMDVYLQAKLQKKYATTTKRVKDDIRSMGFRKEMIISNVRRLKKIVSKLSWWQAKSEWSDYAEDNSYSDQDTRVKEDFIRKTVQDRTWKLVWDLGCNTGNYSRIAAENSNYVIAMDSDHLAVERLYHNLKSEKNKKILPLVVNLADSSPNLGWRGMERKSLTDRGKPDLILALALIHHIVISANIPLAEFIDWLASLGSDLVIEFVTKADPMVKILLKNKDDQYHDYEHENFEGVLTSKFSIVEQTMISSGTRYLYFAKTKKN